MLVHILPAVVWIVSWAMKLATHLVARSLQMPEPLVHDAGVIVYAQVMAAETRAARTLCPGRWVKRLAERNKSGTSAAN